jgi:hypothetical protein
MKHSQTSMSFSPVVVWHSSRVNESRCSSRYERRSPVCRLELPRSVRLCFTPKVRVFIGKATGAYVSLRTSQRFQSSPQSLFSQAVNSRLCDLQFKEPLSPELECERSAISVDLTDRGSSSLQTGVSQARPFFGDLLMQPIRGSRSEVFCCRRQVHALY